ncbi:MAG: hypothetical protein IJZ39_06155 [Oscillospiraceae bacterium]|nr:hypothetical protein [Oscillospiraceae bacterium]
MESVILQSPLALILYGTALFLNLFDRYYKMTRGIMTLIATAVCVAATAYALVMGASMFECAVVLLCFLLLNMGVRE